MMTGQSAWRSTIRNLFAVRRGQRRRSRPWRDDSCRCRFTQAAEVCEARSLLSAPVFAQGIDQAFQNDGAATGSAYINGGIANDSAGNVYVNLAYWGTGNINPNGTPFTVATTDANGVSLLAKYDSNLNLQWALDPARYSTTNTGPNGMVFQHVLVSPVSNDVYLTGALNGTMTLPTAQGTLTVSGATHFVARIDPANGNVLWFVKCGFTPTMTDASGNLYFAGTTNFGGPPTTWTYIYGPGTGGSPISFQPTASVSSASYFFKSDPNGNILWSGNFTAPTGGNLTASGGVGGWAVDNAGNIYGNCTLKGSVDADPSSGIKTLKAVNSSDNVILKIDTNGHLVWTNQNTKAAFGSGSILVDPSGNLDTWFGSLTYPISVTVTGHGKNQVTTITGGNLLKFDNNGNLKWYESIDPNAKGSLYLDAAGNIYFWNTVGTNTDELDKYDSTGTFLWSVPYYGYYMWYFSIDASGNIWSSGINGNSSITTVDVSPTSTPVNFDWLADPSGQYGVYMLVEWTQPGGLAAAAPNGAALGAFASVEGIGSGENGGSKLKSHR
jgi:hypothetical protein